MYILESTFYGRRQRSECETLSDLIPAVLRMCRNLDEEGRSVTLLKLRLLIDVEHEIKTAEGDGWQRPGVVWERKSDDDFQNELRVTKL